MLVEIFVDVVGLRSRPLGIITKPKSRGRCVVLVIKRRSLRTISIGQQYCAQMTILKV